MTPSPQEQSVCGAAAEAGAVLDGERVVISGMSGLFPQSHHVKELSEILYDKRNPVSNENCRWIFNHPEVMNHTGKVPGLDRFDAQFFKVHYKMGINMDSMSKKVLEQAYQAIYDAGLCPNQLWGKKVGVYIGSCFSETEKASFYVASSRTGFGIAGCNKSMFANRISYWLNVKGPSMSIDVACCSSLGALEQAYLAMTRGECEAAIIGGTNLCLHPQSSVHYGRIMDLCADGKTKSFDQNADGCAKSEAINVLFLQKAKDARRIYAEVLHAKTEFTSILPGEAGPRYGFYRNPDDTAKFISKFYQEARIPPQVVEYVEAFGSAVPEADKAELQAIEKVFCENRTDPLLVGSVMSNIGYGEAASGISAVTKVLLGYHNGELAANLHCENPRQDIASLSDGRMRIVNEHQPFRRTFSAVNAMSVTGINAHVLLHGHYKPKDLNRYKATIPRLVAVSGRQESSVNKVLQDLKSRTIDPEEHALLHHIHENYISGHLGRGFTILDTNEDNKTISLCEKADYFDDVKRPLWFVYSGMGSQWAGMGAQLMRIPVFAAAIERCRIVLEPRGVDIVHIITSTDKSIFENILNSFVGIAAIQIGLTDILQALGLVPDKIIGHSVGELGCAYADGCFTAEEMILAAYSRGLVSVKTPFIQGSMAAVGIGFQEISKLCPPEIEVACHNGPESCTISGPADKMHEFVAELTAKKIFAKEVPCSNIAYHSRYIAEAGPGLLKYLKEVIKDPKPRSERWLSTSVPQDKWDQPSAKYSSAEYHTNNLLNPVLFEETSRLVTANAVLLEVAPHGLLQAILKRSLPAGCRNIPLTRRGHPDNALLLLEAVGSLYMAGYNPKIQALYPQVEFPVSTGTPLLSHLVEWAHHEKWSLPLYVSACIQTAAASNFLISLYDKEHDYLNGHVIQGKTLYPFAGALVAAWDTLAMTQGQAKREVSVQFRDVHLYAQPVLHAEQLLRLRVALHRGSGRFEIMSELSKIASGFVVLTASDDKAYIREFVKSEEDTFNTDDIYQALYERDYSYSGEFRSLRSVNTSLTEADIVWSSNWVTFLDGVLQLNALRHAHETVSQVCYIRRLCIDVSEHAIAQSESTDGVNVMKANVCDIQDYTRCGGVLINNIKFRNKAVLHENVKLRSAEYFSPKQLTVKSRVSLQSSVIGDLNSLRWVEVPDPTAAGVMVTVHYAGLSNMDMKKAMAAIPCDNTLNIAYGMDFSGVTESGDRVMGIVSSGAASSRVRARPELLWPVPAHWSLEDAATVPLAYAQAFYCLAVKNLPTHNVSLLVHGGAGALGQAAISIALGLGYQVFTTVSDLRKKRFLCRLFPELKEDHIGNSRDHSFGDMVMLATGGKGCDIVINSLKGELKNTSLKSCASSGIVFDTVQVPMKEDFNFGLSYLSEERNYFAVDFASIFAQDADQQKIRILLSEGISRGYVKPLSRVTYEPSAVSRAFHLLASSQHRGRVLLRLQDCTLRTQPRLTCTAQGSHVVVCDDGLLGLQLADRLIQRGARNVLIHCELLPAHVQLKIRSWQAIGAKVELSSAKLRSSSDVTSLLLGAALMGPVEGVYVAATTADSDTSEHLTHVLALLDAAARALCSALRYFAVVNTAESIGLQTCLARAQSQLPVTLLTLPTKKIEGMSWYRIAVEATERALRSNNPVSVAELLHDQHTPLLQQIATVAGIDIEDGTPTSATLQDLGLECAKLEAVSVYLRDVHYLNLPEEQVLSLTVERINQLETYILNSPPRQLKGLASLFSFVDPDELLATTEMVFLPTLTNSDAMRDEFDVSQTYLCIVPGLEGHHERFRVLCERLKLPALVMQPGLDHLHETVQQTAQRFTNVLLKKAQIKNNFYLLGYESGVLVALEMANILEEHGFSGTVFCLGGGPDEILGELEVQLGEYRTEIELQDAVMRHMYALMEKGNTVDCKNALRGLSDWPLKLEACVRSLLGRVPNSAQYTRALIESAYARLSSARSYTAQPRPLRSRIVLLRAALDSMPAPSVPKLQYYSQQPITVHQLTTPLAHVSADLQCTAIINDHLDIDILKAFEQRNVCETYLLNADTFMKASADDD